MALSRKLFINWHTRSRQRSDVSGAPDVVDTLEFAKYENVPLTIVLVEPDPDTPGPNNFVRVDITDLSLKVVINDTTDDGTPLVEQTTWTKNTADSTFTGYLNLNTAAMNSYVGSTDRTVYFEVETTDSAGARVKVLTEDDCSVIVGVAQTTTTAPDAAKIYLSMDEMIGLFARRVMGPGESIRFVDANGVAVRTIGVNADGTPQDDQG